MLRSGLVSVVHKNGKSYIETSQIAPYPVHISPNLVGERFLDILNMPTGINYINDLSFLGLSETGNFIISFVITDDSNPDGLANVKFGLSMYGYSLDRGIDINANPIQVALIENIDFQSAGNTRYFIGNLDVLKTGNRFVPFVNKQSSIIDSLSIYFRIFLL